MQIDMNKYVLYMVDELSCNELYYINCNSQITYHLQTKRCCLSENVFTSATPENAKINK